MTIQNQIAAEIATVREHIAYSRGVVTGQEGILEAFLRLQSWVSDSGNAPREAPNKDVEKLMAAAALADIPQDEVSAAGFRRRKLTREALLHFAVDNGFTERTAGSLWKFLGENQEFALFAADRGIPPWNTWSDDDSISMANLRKRTRRADFQEWETTGLKLRSKARQLLTALVA